MYSKYFCKLELWRRLIDLWQAARQLVKMGKMVLHPGQVRGGVGVQTVWGRFCSSFISASHEEPAVSPRAAESIADNDTDCSVSAASVTLARATSAPLRRRGALEKGEASMAD